ncbi:hypothetical protein MIND_01239200 [Mycena indigotica]|uniref:DUF6697 domain-containing protein n=1 Tax=Mycena indigotica TaxID=2126181 RepID=A0A8H6S5D4_9AGAR|nr:uncharacterized protein MIND_01239200 [Mycena indigotica]KAF7292122.1 hypothetical protein MIND_01239200 [Mycena indigotica]
MAPQTGTADTKTAKADVQEALRKVQRERDAFFEDIERLRREKVALEGRLSEAEGRLREAGERRVGDAESIRRLERELEAARVEARTAGWAKNDAEREWQREKGAMGGEIEQLKRDSEVQKRQIAGLKRKLKDKTAVTPIVVIDDGDDGMSTLASNFRVKEQDEKAPDDRSTSVASSYATSTLVGRSSETPTGPTKRPHSPAQSDLSSPTKRLKGAILTDRNAQSRSPERPVIPPPFSSGGRAMTVSLSPIKTEAKPGRGLKREVKQEQLALPAALLATHLHSVPPFAIPPPGPSAVYASRRQHLHPAFKGQRQALLPTMLYCPIPGGPEVKAKVLFPQPDFNPLLPRRPGEPGLLFASRPDVAKPGTTYKLFCRRTANGPVVWRYMGEYVHKRVGDVPKETWREQTARVRATWAKHIASSKNGVYTAARQRLQEDSDTGRLTGGDIVTALCNGGATIGIVQMRCVGYDAVFARLVEEAVEAGDAQREERAVAGGQRSKRGTSGSRSGSDSEYTESDAEWDGDEEDENGAGYARGSRRATFPPEWADGELSDLTESEEEGEREQELAGNGAL